MMRKDESLNGSERMSAEYLLEVKPSVALVCWDRTGNLSVASNSSRLYVTSANRSYSLSVKTEKLEFVTLVMLYSSNDSVGSRPARENNGSLSRNWKIRNRSRSNRRLIAAPQNIEILSSISEETKYNPSLTMSIPEFFVL